MWIGNIKHMRVGPSAKDAIVGVHTFTSELVEFMKINIEGEAQLWWSAASNRIQYVVLINICEESYLCFDRLLLQAINNQQRFSQGKR